ncbi:hypothetical protein VSR68_37030 [Paraburkholderia phymatum]|uniref:hypothetical protein n=1 Tax=Paraburkholderia phymatum TaxID=148447 RepID=UPI0031739965
MQSKVSGLFKRLLRIDVIGSQMAGIALFIYWLTGVWSDVASGHIFTSTERSVSLWTGVAIALLFRSAFRRWAMFRWFGRSTLVFAVAHTFLPFDGFSVISMLALSTAIALEVFMSRSCSSTSYIRSRLDRMYGRARGDDALNRHDALLAPAGSRHSIIDAAAATERGLQGSCDRETAFVTSADDAGAQTSAGELISVSAMNSSALSDARARDTRRADQPPLAVPDPDAVASYIRVELRLMAGELRISRYVMHYAVFAMRDVPVSEIGAILERIIDEAMLRRCREGGGATITAEDVRTALRG